VRVPWLTFVVSWFVVGLVLFIPHFESGYLYNASPALLAYVVVLAGSTDVAVVVLPWFALHLLLAVAATLAVGGVRRRLSRSQFTRVLVVAAGLLVGLVGWAVHVCWPDGVYFDSANLYYDVSDLVGPGTGPEHFATASDLAAVIEQHAAGRGEHYLPHNLFGFSDAPTLHAWGTWPEQRRLRQALEALRAH
jgi:hypothetical protein